MDFYLRSLTDKMLSTHITRWQAALTRPFYATRPIGWLSITNALYMALCLHQERERADLIR